MARLSLILLVLATIAALFSYSIGCGGQSPEPGSCPSADDPLRLHMSSGNHHHQRGWDASLKEVDNAEEIYFRVTSEDLVEVVYERDGQIVVETYSASDTEIIETWKEEE